MSYDCFSLRLSFSMSFTVTLSIRVDAEGDFKVLLDLAQIIFVAGSIHRIYYTSVKSGKCRSLSCQRTVVPHHITPWTRWSSLVTYPLNNILIRNESYDLACLPEEPLYLMGSTKTFTTIISKLLKTLPLGVQILYNNQFKTNH